MSVREIVLDTETTGLDADNGDRIIEIGCVELINKIPTGRVFHEYINPEREVPYHVTKIHGITTDMLKDKPIFSEIANELIEFISDDILVIHNAGFDIKFLNMEFDRINKRQEFKSIDTLSIARKKFPGASVSLDSLCKRFNVSLEQRKFHGALLDANLLAQVYVELMGGVQISLSFDVRDTKGLEIKSQYNKEFLVPRDFFSSQDEIVAHKEFLMKIKNPLWNRFLLEG